MEKKFFSNHGVVMYLFKEIITASEFFGCGYIANDFLIDGQKMNDWFRSHDMKPFYVCVRNAGTETGSYDYVMTRCLSLGRPVKVYVIAKSDFGEFKVDVRYNL